MTTSRTVFAVCAATALSVGFTAELAHSAGEVMTSSPVQTVTAPAITASPATLVAQVAGVADGPATLHPNNTPALADMNAADLGITWDNGNGVSIAFGDNFGAGWHAPVTCSPTCVPSSYTSDYRSNALGKSTDTNLADGMAISSMIKDSTGHRAAILPRIGNEVAAIPTTAVHIGSTDYLWYMAVNHWGPAGYWNTNGQGIAVSTNGGQNWTRTPTVWSNNSGTDPFQQSAAAQNGDGYVYMWGTPNGRFGPASLARVPETSILSLSAYQYWNGTGWVTGENNARPVVPAAVGELSVVWDQQLNSWIMTYLDQAAGNIVLRTAPAPQGPWSPEQTLIGGVGWQTYGAFIDPRSDGADIYFVSSMWNPYQSYLFHTTLTATTAVPTKPTCGG